MSEASYFSLDGDTGSSAMNTPSPSPPHQSQQGANGSRRPPRKSTLTQQQKNQKRQRATQDQLIILEAEFNKNPTPTAVVRERIAQEINMTERSVQIWFQNRRAKIKLMAKKSIETGEDCDAIPECMRQHMAAQAMEAGRGFSRSYLGDRSRNAYSPYGNGHLTPEPSPQGKIVIHHFKCRSLSIGTWRRVGQNAMDLVIFYSPEKACITYYINNDSAGYKIEFPFAFIKDIVLEPLDTPLAANGGQKQGQLVITLTQPPLFYMDSSGSGGFYQCGDFTEDQQASQILVHHLGGHPDILSGQLAKLMTLEAFANRHAQMHHLQFFDQHMSASAPVSPHIIRPASSNDVGPMLYPQDPSMGHHNFHQKHRRTRSRSVPIAVDFSQMQHNMPSFSFQDSQEHLYAPAPQHQHALINQHQQGLNHPLRIDTSSSGFLEYRPSYPLSAATTTSPSDYASPSMMNTNLQPDIQSGGYGTPYSLPYLSPSMVDHASIVGPSVSPISMSGDSVIASGSPPLSHLHRPASTDMYPGHFDHQAALQEDRELSEMYSKQTLGISVSPVMGNSEEVDEHNASCIDVQHMMHYGMAPDANGM
ncbi:Transcription factor [Rhizina undulata]